MLANHMPARPRAARAFPSPDRLHIAAAAAVAITALTVPDAQARITRIDVNAHTASRRPSAASRGPASASTRRSSAWPTARSTRTTRRTP